MPSLVNELQQLASDSTAKVTDLLRKALVVASKLKLDEFKQWIQHEVSGYPDNVVPAYRKVVGQLVHMDRWGTQELHFRDNDLDLMCSTHEVNHSIAEVEKLVATTGPLAIVLSPQRRELLAQSFGRADLNPRLYVTQPALHAIIEGVRNAVLEWALKLEDEGITGEGLSFTDAEKRKAQTTPVVQHIKYYVGRDLGVAGDITAHNVIVGDYGSIRETIRKSGLSREARHELEDILDGLKDADDDDKESWAQQGIDWLGRNAKNVGVVAKEIRDWFTPHLDDSEENEGE